MNDHENLILKSCLEYCINHKKTIYTLNDFIAYTKSQQSALYDVFLKANSLFDIEKSSNNNSIIQISIKLTTCFDYGDGAKVCNERCNHLHICHKKMYFKKCTDPDCRKLHNFKNSYNLNLLKKHNLNSDPDLVLRFYQTFYSINQDNEAASFTNKHQQPQDKLKEDLKEMNVISPNKVEVKLPESFVIIDNKNLFSKIFSSEAKSSGGEISDLVYLPEEARAIVTYKSELVAKRVVERNEVTYIEHKFIVKPYFETVTFVKVSQVNSLMSQSSIQENQPSSTREENINKRQLYLKNVASSKSQQDIERFGFYLTNVNVASSLLVDDKKGIWILKFTSDISYTNIKNNYPKVKSQLPPGAKYERVYNNDQTSTLTSQNAYELVKPLNRNSFLSIVLRDRNKAWKNRLFELIQKENAKIIYDDRNFKVVSNPRTTMSEHEWLRKTDFVLKNYFNEFKMETITYEREQYQDIVQLMDKIEEIRKLYLIDYLNKTDIKSLFIIGRKEHIEDFYQRNERFKKLSKTFKAENDSSVVLKSINIPKLQNDDSVYNKNELINMIMPKIKSMFDIQEYIFITGKGLIEFYGPKKSVDDAISLLKINFAKIKCKQISVKLNILNDDLFKYILTRVSNDLKMILNGILEKDEAVKNLFYKLHVKISANSSTDSNNNNKNNDSIQIYLTYFYDFKEINSNLDSVYDSINTIINNEFILREVNISMYANFILSSKWKDFEEENLSSKAIGNQTFYALCNNQNGLIKVLLAGLKTQVAAIKGKIEAFLANNEFKLKTISLDEDSMLYLNNVAKDTKKALESKYEINIDLDTNSNNGSFSLMIKNCPNNLLAIVEKNIRDECARKISKIYTTEYLAGLNVALSEKSPFRHEIINISNETNSVVKITNITVKPIDKSISNVDENNADIKPKSSLGGLFFRIANDNSNDINEIRETIEIGKSKIRLEIGNILSTKAEVIVNSTTNKLNLNSGILSKSILESAGVGILDECKLKYPNGIDSNSIAITTAGKIKDVKYLYHVAPTNYQNETQADLLSNIISNCLNGLKNMCCSTISFPSIGTRGFGYPADLVALLSLKSAIFFLDKNKDSKYLINFVVYQKDADIIQAFEKIFLEFKKQLGITKTKNEQKTKLQEEFKDNKEKAQASFKIISKNEESFKKTEKMIQDLIFKNYINKDELSNDSVKMLTRNEIAQLASKFANCEISYQNGKLNFTGFSEEVLKAKNEANTFVIQKMLKKTSEFEEKLSMCKDVQWQWQSDDWKSFPLYINSVIESAYLKKQLHVTFVNEEDEEAQVYFNVNPNVYTFLEKNFRIRRFEISKFGESFQFPAEWAYINEDDYHIVDVANTSAEYLNVYNDFKAKFGGQNIATFTLQRIQNKPLFKQYSVYKEKLAKKYPNCNEYFLFHGTQEKNIESIAKFGFNRSLCGVNGVSLGHGVYFAVNSSYSHNYAGQGLNTRKMFRTRVVAGESCLGNSSMKVPPNKPNGEPYDSTCDQGRQVFVCYHDNQCYPEYIITYSP